MKPKPADLFTLLLALGAPFSASAANQQGETQGAHADHRLAPIRIATGADAGVDGYLEIGLDEYGSWGGFGVPGSPSEDLFKPIGGSLQTAAFSAGFFLLVPDRAQRELLSENADWQAVYGPDASLTRTITAPNVASDANSDGILDTLSSSFDVVGGATDLSFHLVQSTAALEPGVSMLTQNYTITNHAAEAIDFDMVRIYDGDLVWDGDHTNDEGGTTMHGDDHGGYIFLQEASAPGATAVTIWDGSPADLGAPTGALLSVFMRGEHCFASKNGVVPDQGPPAYSFGTSTEVWDNFGVPNSWQSHIAGVGYETNGVSGPAPPGSLAPEDAAIGANFAARDLASGASTVLKIHHIFGANTPPEVGAGELSFSGSCPGSIDIVYSGGTPNGSAATIFSSTAGTDPLTGGPCVGAATELSDPTLLSLIPLDGTGSFSMTRTVGATACGLLLQVVDAATCELSAAEQIPD